MGVKAVTRAAPTDDSDFLREIMERMVREPLETEMTAYLGAERYGRSAERKRQRNGDKPRMLHTR